MNLDQNTARSRFRCPSAQMTEDQENQGHFTSYDVSRFLGLNPGKGMLNRIQQPIVIVADTFVSNSSFTNPWNSNDSGMGNLANRLDAFRHNGGTRRNVGLTDGSARSSARLKTASSRMGATSSRTTGSNPVPAPTLVSTPPPRPIPSRVTEPPPFPRISRADCRSTRRSAFFVAPA